MIKRWYSSYLAFLNRYATANPHTPIVGLARSILALGTLITLTFSSVDVLFDSSLFGRMNFGTFLDDINLFYLFEFKQLIYAKLLSISILLLVISGIYPRITSVLHWWVSFSFQQSASIIDGGDQVTSILTLLLIPIMIFDNRNNHWTPTNSNNNLFTNFLGNIFIKLISLQMAIIYFHSAIEKMYKSIDWRNGTAVYYFFHDSLFGYPDWMNYLFGQLLSYAFIVSSLTWGTIIFEIILFGAIFMSDKKRDKLFIFAFIFHLMIAIIFGLASFFLAMTGGLIIYLLNNQNISLITVLKTKQWNKT